MLIIGKISVSILRNEYDTATTVAATLSASTRPAAWYLEYSSHVENNIHGRWRKWMMMYVLCEGLIEGRLNTNQSTESDVVSE